MSKFETVNTLMYQFLIDDLKEQILLGEQRVGILNGFEDFKDAVLEEQQVIKWKEQLTHLESYLSVEEKCTSNRPSYIEISHFDNFGSKINTEDLNGIQLDESEYYYKPTGIKLCDWTQLEEDKLFIFDNLTLKVTDGVLMSKYPQETLWYHLSEDFAGDKRIFDMYGDKEVYYKN